MLRLFREVGRDVKVLSRGRARGPRHGARSGRRLSSLRARSSNVLTARASVSDRAWGLARFGIDEDAEAFEGRLWLGAAWALREAAVAGDDVRRLPFLYAPASPEKGGTDLAELLAKLPELGGAESTP